MKISAINITKFFIVLNILFMFSCQNSVPTAYSSQKNEDNYTLKKGGTPRRDLGCYYIVKLYGFYFEDLPEYFQPPWSYYNPDEITFNVRNGSHNFGYTTVFDDDSDLNPQFDEFQKRTNYSIDEPGRFMGSYTEPGSGGSIYNFNMKVDLFFISHIWAIYNWAYTKPVDIYNPGNKVFKLYKSSNNEYIGTVLVKFILESEN